MRSFKEPIVPIGRPQGRSMHDAPNGGGPHVCRYGKHLAPALSDHRETRSSEGVSPPEKTGSLGSNHGDQTVHPIHPGNGSRRP